MKPSTYGQSRLVLTVSVAFLLWLGGCQNRDPIQYVKNGDSFYRLGYNDRAITEYDKAIEENPQLTRAYLNRGVAYWRKAEYERSILDFNEALQIDPGNAHAYGNLAASQYHLHQYSEALTNTNHALQLDPNLTYARFNLGLIYATLGDWEKAKAEYEKAIKANNQRADEGSVEQVQLALQQNPRSVPLKKALELLQRAQSAQTNGH